METLDDSLPSTNNLYSLTLNLITNMSIVRAVHGKMLIHHSISFKLLPGWEDLNIYLWSSNKFLARISVHYKQKDWSVSRNRQSSTFTKEQIVPVGKLHLNYQHSILRLKEMKQ